MSDKKSAIPIEQREIEFYDDMVTAVVAEDGTVYVPLKPLCKLIGVDWDAQRRRVDRDPILSELSMSAAVTAVDIDGTTRRPKTSHMITLPLDALNGWLFGINANRVDKSIRDDLLRYQRECYKVLYEAFSTGVAVRPDNDIMQSSEPAAVSFRTLTQMARLAREHYYLTKQIDENTKQIEGNSKRLGLIEAQLSNPSSYVTQEQAQLISGAVKAIATVLGKASGRNEFGAVYGELYSRYGVTSYKHIPAERFDNVMGWLRSWWAELTDNSDLPF